MEKNNSVLKFVVIILSIIIVLLVSYVIYDKSLSNGETTNVGDNNTEINDNKETTNVDGNNTETNGNSNDNKEVVRYYQWYPIEDESLGGYNSFSILELKNDHIAKFSGAKRNASGWIYEGTYVESDSQIVFTAIIPASEHSYEEVVTHIFKKQDNDLYDERDLQYLKVTKEELKVES